MTVLAPMTAATFPHYQAAAVAGYAADNVDAGRWPAEVAIARSQADFEASLPQGLATPDNFLFDIRAGADGPVVGHIWFAIVEKNGIRSAFVYDVEVLALYRRQGHAKAAFEALEPIVRSLGLDRIGLHVFSHNPAAQALYSRLGYAVTSINMQKQLGKPDA